MNAALDRRRFGASVFHDVDFPTRRPTCSREIVTEQPKGWPHSASVWNFDPRCKATIFLGESSLGLETRRGIAALDSGWCRELFLDSFDDQVPFFQVNVFAAGRVILQLIVSPAVSTTLDNPLGRVGRRPSNSSLQVRTQSGFDADSFEGGCECEAIGRQPTTRTNAGKRRIVNPVPRKEFTAFALFRLDINLIVASASGKPLT